MNTVNDEQLMTTVPESTGEQLLTQTQDCTTNGTVEDTTTTTKTNQVNRETNQEVYDPNRIYYKKCGNAIVTLALYPSSKLNDCRSNIIDPSHAKLRTDKAFVLDIEDMTTGAHLESVKNTFYSNNFIEYKVGTKIVTNYNTDLNNICTEGIHIFKTRKTAELFSLQDNEVKNYTGIYCTYHQNGAIANKANVINGKIWYEYYIYDEYGVLNLKSYYLNGKRNGKFYEYYENKLYKEYTYVNDLLEGPYIVYDYNTQKVRRQFNYKNNILDGPCYYIFENKKFEGYYKNGVHHLVTEPVTVKDTSRPAPHPLGRFTCTIN